MYQEKTTILVWRRWSSFKVVSLYLIFREESDPKDNLLSLNYIIPDPRSDSLIHLI